MRKIYQVSLVVLVALVSAGATYAVTQLTISNTANVQTLQIPIQILDPGTRQSISTIDWGNVLQGTVIYRDVIVRNTISLQVTVSVAHTLAATHGRFTIFNPFTGTFAETQDFIMQPNQEVSMRFNWEVSRDAPTGSVNFDIVFS